MIYLNDPEALDKQNIDVFYTPQSKKNVHANTAAILFRLLEETKEDDGSKSKEGYQELRNIDEGLTLLAKQ